MSDTDEPQHRTYHQPDPDAVELRDSDEEDGTFSLRLPIVTTGEVRNDGDDPFEREALEGMAEQINDGQVSVFPNHGASPDMAPRYGASQKMGYWADAEVEGRDDGESQVTATAVLMEPDGLPAETPARSVLASIKAQAERGVPISTSIGWQENEDAPGGNDLWEASIVGIPADPRTTEDDVAVAAARGVLADADLEPEQRERLVEEFRAVVMGSDAEGGNARDSVTDDENESPDDESGDGSREEQNGISAEEFREQMLEMQRNQTETLDALAESMREEDDEDEDGGDDEEEESEGDDEDEDEEDEQSASTQTVEIDGEEREVEGLVEDHQTALEELRANGIETDDLDIPEADAEQDAEGEGGEERDADSTDTEPSFSFTEDHE